MAKPIFFIVQGFQPKVPETLLAKIGGEIYHKIRKPNDSHDLHIKALKLPNEKEWKLAGWKLMGVL